MFTAVIFVAAVIFAAIAFAMVSPESCLDVLVWYFLPDNSLDPAGRIHMFHLHPSNVDIVTMMFATLPTLVLVDMLLSTRTYLGKFFVAATWVVSLFVLEEIFLIQLLPPELFVAVLALSAMYLLAFLRIPSIIKVAFLLIGRILGICLRTIRFTLCLIVKCLISLILAPLVLQMLVQDFLRIVSNTNLPTVGLVVIVGSSIAILLYVIVEKLLQLALRLFDVTTDAIASFIVHLPSATLTTQEETPLVPRSPQRTVERPPRHVVNEPRPPVVSWPDGAHVHCRFRPYYKTGHTFSIEWLLGILEEDPRSDIVKGHTKQFGCVLDEVMGLLSDSDVRFVPKGEEGRTNWPDIRAARDWNYRIHFSAQLALEDLIVIYDHFKRDNPLRFRSWSDYEKSLRECKLFEQGIDIIFLEMKLRAEFHPTPLFELVHQTWEEAAFDNAELIEEAAVEPVARAREDADATPPIQEEDRLEVEAPVEVLVVEEPLAFDQPDAVEEREEKEDAPTPTPNVKRRRRSREAASLNSELGEYWVSPSLPRRAGRPRRGGRQPVPV